MTAPTLLQRVNQWLLENPVGHGDSIRQRNASLLVTELRDELNAREHVIESYEAQLSHYESQLSAKETK